jgi:AcrR family transcriptional regulator
MTLDGDQTRAKLLAEARDLYLEQGFVSFSLREVARRIDLSAAAIYRHYDGKEALLRAVASEGFRIFSSYLLRALDCKSAEARLKRSIEEYLRFALENPRDYRFIFMSSVDDRAAVVASPADHERAPTYQFLIDRVNECMQSRVLDKGNPEVVATVIWAEVHGLVSLRLSGLLARVGNDEQFTRFFHNATAHLFVGLMP